MIEEKDFDKFSQELEQASNSISNKRAVITQRKGKAKVRDVIVLLRMAWNEAFSFISPVQTALIFTGLITPSIITINVGLQKIGNLIGIQHPFQFPIDWVALACIVGMVGIVIFGIISVRNIGTVTSAAEYSTKMNSGMYLLWKKIDNVEKEVEKLKKER